MKGYYCLAVCKRSDWYDSCRGKRVPFEYFHFTENSYEEAMEYAQKYSAEHEGMVVCVSQRRRGSSIPNKKFFWQPLGRYYNGRIHDKSY